MMVKPRLALMMFAQYFAWGVWLVPLSTYMSKGLKFDAVIGAAYGLIGIATIASTLFVGMVADRFWPAQKLLGVLSLGAGAALLWVSTIVSSPALFLAGCLLHFLFYASTIPLATAIAFNAMRDVGREFPAIRVWGTIGWIVAGLLVGSIAGAASTALPMRVAGIVYLALGLYAFTLPNTPAHARGTPIDVAGLFGLDVIVGYRDKAFWIFIACTLALMVPKSFYDTYANTFFVEKNLVLDLFGARLEATAIQTAGQMFETVFLVSLPFLLTRLGIKQVLVIGMAAWALRFVLFGWGYVGDRPIVPMLLLGIVIHGICYDFLFVSGQIYVDRKFGLAARSRAQAFLTLITQGIGVLVGSNIAGLVYRLHTNGDVHDWRAIWLVPALVALVAALLFAWFFREKDARAVDREDLGLATAEVPGH